MTALTTIRKKQKLIASFFLSVITVAEISAAETKATSTAAMINQPIAASASQYVDPFTGDFNYSVPLLTVPGPNGENVPVTANYHAGIRMNQQASWIGLGWDYNPGEISRQVSGVPDDCNAKVKHSFGIAPSGGYPIPTSTLTCQVLNAERGFYGPLYYNIPTAPSFPGYNIHNDINTLVKADVELKSHDMYQNNKAKTANGAGSSLPNTSLKFGMADFDKYMISGPGLGGSIKPFINYKPQLKYDATSISSPGSTFRKMQFYYQGGQEVTDVSNPPIESTTNQLQSGYYIKYFTNSEINSGITTNGFIDYANITSSPRRPSSTFDPDGIGGFQITLPNGTTYHYSLPVYQKKESYTSFSLSSGTADYSKPVEFSQNLFSYASSWKLTAVTGNDYVDVNGNHVVDDADKGYWIAYDYALWDDNYFWSSSPFSFKTDWTPKPIPKTVNSNIGYSPKGSILNGINQVYYLNKIKTATHTAFFVKDIREDEQDLCNLWAPSTYSKTPLLKLNRIVLLRNEDASLFNGSASIPAISGFSTSGCNPAGDILHMGIYNANEANINAASLKTVEFDTDYSLCNKYYLNIRNSFTASAFSYSYSGNFQNYFNSFHQKDFLTGISNAQIGFNKPGSVSSSNPTNSGKLTLKSIKVYEVGKEAVFPSYDFDYVTNNPDYDCQKEDMWGYYKSDFDGAAAKRSFYTTPTSSLYVDAWSLKKITTPLGGTISVSYESDKYEHERRKGDKPYIIMLADGTSGGSFPYFTNESDYYAYSSVVGDWFVSMPANANGCDNDVAGPINYGWIHDNTSTTPYMYPDANDFGCIDYSYSPNEMEWGFQRIEIDYMYGGGLRVKDITISDPESSSNYKMNYTYADGLCVIKPDKYTVDYKYHLIDNSDITDRENTISGVGYEKVTIETVDNTNANDGTIEYLFETINDPGHFKTTPYSNTAIYQHSPTNYFRCGCTHTTLYNSNDCMVNNTTKTFSFNIEVNPGELPLFGKLIKKTLKDKNGAVLSFTKNFYKKVNSIRELYTIFDNTKSSTNYFPFSGTATQPAYSMTTHLFEVNCSYPQLYNYTVTTIINTLGISAVHYNYIIDKTETYSNGITTTSFINERDPNTMQTLSSTIVDPTQGAITTTVKPAYTNTVSYSDMGMKSSCSTCSSNKNQLSLVEEQRVIKQPVFRSADGVIAYNSSAPGILMGASKQTFANSVYHRKYNTGTSKYETTSEAIDSWLPYESYTALTNSSTPSTTTTPEWKKMNTNTLFTTTNKVLETEDMAGRKSAVKYGYNNLYPLASISDANYNCFAFSSFEDKTDVSNGSSVWHFGGEITGGNFQSGTTNAVTPHTGNYIAALPANNFGPGISFNGYEKGRTYRASVWVHKSSPDNAALCINVDGSVNGSPSQLWYAVNKNDASNITVGDWILMSVQVTIPENYVESGGTGNNNFAVFLWNTGTSTAYYDDLMIRPIDAPITGNVYEPKTGRVIAVLDNENFASWYEYDAAGRVIATFVETREGVKKTSETQYNFGRNN